MQETESIDEYILQHIDAESDYLKALYRDTHVKLLRPRMASGHLQGRMLKMFVEMIRPRHILAVSYTHLTLPTVGISLPTIHCGMVMCWNNLVVRIRRPLASKHSMTPL